MLASNVHMMGVLLLSCGVWTVGAAPHYWIPTVEHRKLRFSVLEYGNITNITNLTHETKTAALTAAKHLPDHSWLPRTAAGHGGGHDEPTPEHSHDEVEGGGDAQSVEGGQHDNPHGEPSEETDEPDSAEGGNESSESEPVHEEIRSESSEKHISKETATIDDEPTHVTDSEATPSTEYEPSHATEGEPRHETHGEPTHETHGEQTDGEDIGDAYPEADHGHGAEADHGHGGDSEHGSHAGGADYGAASERSSAHAHAIAGIMALMSTAFVCLWA